MNQPMITKSRMACAAVLLAAIALGACAHATPEQLQDAAAAKHLAGPELKSTLAGNSLSGISKKGPTYAETYIANGSIRGLWDGKEKYTGTWHVDGDKWCVDYDGSSDSDGCDSLALNGAHIYWLKDDGSAWNPERPGTLTQGNPDNL